MNRFTDITRISRLASQVTLYKFAREAGNGATPAARKLRRDVCRTARKVGLSGPALLQA